MNDIYHKGNRSLQDQFDSRRLADFADKVIVHDHITDEDCQFIKTRDMLFISTVDEQGRPTVSFKGGDVGFIRVLDEKNIAFPGYDGNGMFLTAGNILSNDQIGLLFIDFENPHRIRLHGTATIHMKDPLINEFPGAQYMTRIFIRNLFVNCPRYIHHYKKIKQSVYIPKEGYQPPVPRWKTIEGVKDLLPKDKR